MVYQMLLGDLVRFGVIYIIFLVGFAQGFFFLFKNGNDDNSDVQKFATIQDTLMTLFQMTLGEFKYDAFNYANYPPLTKLIFAIFMILVPILLLNMLIAMMGNTYQQIIAKSEKEWRKQWAKTVVVLERGFSKKDLIKFQKEYSVRISHPQENEKRALVVIKTASKTKAQSRKSAETNWKWVAKKVVCQLKEGGNAPLKQISPRQQIGNEAFNETVAQIAWQEDIDLTKGHAFITSSQINKLSPRSETPSVDSSQTNLTSDPVGKIEHSVPQHVAGPNIKMLLPYKRVHPYEPTGYFQKSIETQEFDSEFGSQGFGEPLCEQTSSKRQKAQASEGERESPLKSLSSAGSTLSWTEETTTVIPKHKRRKHKKRKSSKHRESASQSSIISLLGGTDEKDSVV